MTTDADLRAVQSVISAWIEAANANDPEKMVGLATDQFEMIPPGLPPAAGSQSLEFLRGFFDGFRLQVNCTTMELVVSGELAFQRYAYEQTLTPKAAGEPMTVKGHGVHLLLRQGDGSWKFAKDIWTSVPESSPER